MPGTSPAQIAIATGGLTGTGRFRQPTVCASCCFRFHLHHHRRRIRGSRYRCRFALTLFLVIRGISIALASKTTFGRYLAFGITAYFALQSILIVGGNLGLLPLTGVTLPFISYGGSSLVTNILSVLLLLRISTETSAQDLPKSACPPTAGLRNFTGISC